MNLSEISQNLEQKRFENAKKLKDYLFKKSPSVLKGYQKRFFLIADDGKQLAWFKNNNVSTKPKGSIIIQNIVEIKDEKKNQFSLVYPDRVFQLKAENKDQKETWISNLEFLRTYKIITTDAQEKSLETPKEKLSEPQSRASSIGCDQSKKIKKNKKEEWKNIDQAKLHLIVQEKEKILADETALTKTLDNKTVLTEKGIWQYLQYIKPDEIVSHRLLTGFLDKRSKGKVKYFQRRWFVMVSAKPLWEDKQDEEILEENKLPPWMELDTLYYYKVKSKKHDKKENQKGEIKMKDCLEIIEKKMEKSKEKGYSFKVNLGDRLFHLNTESEAERKKWVDGLRNSMVTAKEKKKGIRKNIDNIVSVFDAGKSQADKTKNIRAKMDIDIKKLRDRILPENEKINNFETLTNFLDHMKIDLMDVMTACLAKEPKRTDIIKEYIDYYHERICLELTLFWDAYYDTMGNFNYLSISMWIYNYAEALKQFFDDERIRSGIKILLNIYYSRTLESSQQIVDGIVEYEKKNNMNMNEDNNLISSSPFDLFKIINEIFDLGFKLCPLKEMGLKLAAIAKNIISFYQSKLEDVMEEEELETKRYIVLCNNTITFSNLIKEYNDKLQKVCNLKPEECEKNFDSSTLLKNFVSISTNAKNHVFYNLFSELNQSFKTFFINVNLEKIFEDFKTHKETISLLHESFSRKLWRSLLEKIVILYFQCFILSCNKVTTNDYDKFIDKMDNDKQFLIAQFSGIVFDSSIKTIMNPFDEMMNLLEESNIFKFQSYFKNLRSVFGRPFTERAVKLILNLRNDIDTVTKNDISDACREALIVYNKEHMEQSLIDSGTFVHEFEEGMDLEDDELNEDEKPAQIRRRSLKLEDAGGMEVIDEEKMETESTTSKDQEKEINFIGEGYMQKKLKTMIKMKKWDKRYFRIKNGVLYWYLNERSRESQNKINFSDVDEVLTDPKPKKKTKFSMRLENGKVYRFSVASSILRDSWVEALRSEVEKAKNFTDNEEITQFKVSTGEGKNPLFKDYDEIRRKEKAVQALKAKEEKKEFKKKKKSVAIQKNKIMAARMETSVMNNPKILSPFKNTLTSTQGSIQEESETGKTSGGCWEKFMDCLGLGAPKVNHLPLVNS